MPVTTFVLGAAAWTLLDHKPQTSARVGETRCVPVGVLHALDPEDHTTVCSGETMAVDPRGRSFDAWMAGSCPECSEALAPQGHRRPGFRSPGLRGRADRPGA